MTAVAPVTIVRRPISFKIFGIAVGLLVMMIFVTLYSSRYLSEVSEKLELLKSSYIELDQRMGNIRADLLVEVLLIERVLHYKPKVVDGSVAAAAAFYKEAGNCEGETLRAIYAKIRAAYPLRGEQQLMLYRVRRLCTQAKLQSADLIVDKALANTVVRNDPDQIARFSSIKADLQNFPQSRDKLHQYFEKYLSQLEKADEAGLLFGTFMIGWIDVEDASAGVGFRFSASGHGDALLGLAGYAVGVAQGELAFVVGGGFQI